MFVRIVKLSFHPEHCTAFLANFELMKQQCRNPQLLQVDWPNGRRDGGLNRSKRRSLNHLRHV